MCFKHRIIPASWKYTSGFMVEDDFGKRNLVRKLLHYLRQGMKRSNRNREDEKNMINVQKVSSTVVND